MDDNRHISYHDMRIPFATVTFEIQYRFKLMYAVEMFSFSFFIHSVGDIFGKFTVFFSFLVTK